MSPRQPETEYTPARVERGIRDLIIWETRTVPNVRLYPTVVGYNVHVALAKRAVARRAQFEDDLRLLLPDGYTLKLKWTD